jgi:glycosyltransferase involved in cell wall biosynthesis
VKTVLIVTYAFPPRNIVGAIRPLKFARYLPEFGWRPIVLTVKEGVGWGGGIDETLLEQLSPEVHIVRTVAIEPPYRVVSGLAGGDPRQAVPVRKRLLRALRTLLLIPDDKIGWFPFALWSGQQILRQQRIDVVFSTSPPPTSHLIGAVISRMARCPLVTDFRDPWTQFALHTWLRNPIRRSIEEALEHAVLRRSACVVGVTPPRTKEMADKYPDIPKERFVTITNGFDREDYAPSASPPNNERFTFVYTGSFYYDRQPDVFFKSVRALLDDNPHLEDRLLFLFAGPGKEFLDRLITHYNLQSIVHSLGYVSFQESVTLQKGADALLLFLGDAPMSATWYPAKVFEYLATGRPILALVPEGITADLLREAGTGIVVCPDDSRSLSEALLNLYLDWQQGRLPILKDPGFLESFERRCLTKQLASLLDTLTPCASVGRR